MKIPHDRKENEHRPPQVGAEGGLDWLTAGALGALMGVGEEALLGFLGSFAMHLRERGHFDCDVVVMVEEAQAFLADYRAYLKSQGVSNA